MGARGHVRAVSQEPGDRRHRRPDPEIVFDGRPPVFVRRTERDVEVDPQQHPGAVKRREILEERQAHQWSLFGTLAARAASVRGIGGHEVLPRPE